MSNQFDQIIVGGGIIGVSIAYQLSKRGYQVLLLEAKEIGAEASSAAAGMLGVQVEFKEDSPMFQFAKESRSLYPKLAIDLYSESGIDIQFEEKGAFKLIYREEEKDQLKAIQVFQHQNGVEAHIVSPQEMGEKEIAKDFYQALECPNEGQVSAPHLTKAFAKAAEHYGAKIIEQTEVQQLVIMNNKVMGVKTSNQCFNAEQVIIACGFRCSAFEKYLPSLKVIPVKGECISVITEKPLIQSTIFTESCYLVPKQGNRIIIGGATSKPYQSDKQVNVESILYLLNSAKKVLPNISEASIEKIWAGVRPLSGDGYPYLGESSAISGLFIATGHYRNGILLAPNTSIFMADLIEGKTVEPNYVEAFSLSRTYQISG
ncbi:glycine oxidase ThiO [Gracilibacillus boraciitolerans JCM 21714]|uniref:glycine oxidase n=1 Tax=Gracilibacillus boraciitolerans JCM 21714 TaxID=1298598 RepID=W4VJT5_9BACI|nr:glycine oxidase ThiO [Gracilibacillus boraciitolerans]GAE93670.1 glycine oxidase ThiO [Gracilibacillus boraciitolerans JCM 21714]